MSQRCRDTHAHTHTHTQRERERERERETERYMWNTDLIQIQQYYEKQVMLRGGHIQEREGKRRKLKR
jgi:hypothetical protein